MVRPSKRNIITKTNIPLRCILTPERRRVYAYDRKKIHKARPGHWASPVRHGAIGRLRAALAVFF